MYKIKMVDEHILARRVNNSKSEFSNPGDIDLTGAIYKIDFAGPEGPYKPGDLVMLAPATYPGLNFEGETYTKITETDIIAVVQEDKNVS